MTADTITADLAREGMPLSVARGIVRELFNSNHPLEGLSHGPSDGERPGAPAKEAGSWPSAAAVSNAGVPAPDSNPILKQARAL